jgi:hypothetical protein
MTSPQGEAYYSLFQRLAYIVSDIFPDLSLRDQTTKMAEAMRAGARQTGEQEGLMAVAYPLAQITTADSLAFGVLRVMQAKRLHVDMPKQIQNFILGYRKLYSRDLDPPMASRLKALAREAAQYKD